MNKLYQRILTSFFLYLLLYLAFNFQLILFLLLLFLSYLVLIESNFILKKIFKKNINLFLSILFICFYTALFCLTIVMHLTPFDYENKISLVLILIICIATDIGGYIFGKLIGGKKLTKISPKKTYVGVLGSFIFAFFFGYMFYNLYANNLLFNIHVLILIFSISLISQIGDLLISFFKRKANVKDSGTIPPGHGGILDRIDGILFAIPIGIILLII